MTTTAVSPVLVGLAHGSRHPETTQAVDDLLACVAELARSRGLVLRTRSAYLDLCEPDLATVARELAAEGATAATVVPLLFTSAFHATVDVPDAVRAVVAELPLGLVTADIVGTGDDVAGVLARSLDAAGVRPERVLLFSVGSSQPEANTAVSDLGRRLGERCGLRVLTAFGTCEPRGRDRLDELSAGDVVLPLFFSPGLLLDPMRAASAERGVTVLPHLGRLLAPVVLDRFTAAVQAGGHPLPVG